MKLHQLIAYGLMTAGTMLAAKSLTKRRQWEQANIHAAIMLDWDDVQAVATRAQTGGGSITNVADLLGRYRKAGATHLSIPELTLNWLLVRGQVSLTQGSNTHRVYLQAKSATLADLVVTELQTRLPHLNAERSKGQSPVISFVGDLPSVAEVGLGFNPAHADVAHQAGLEPAARPIGFSWVQPEMIARTFNQAAQLGCKIVAVQGHLIPGHEFKIQHTVEAMQRNQLTYAYFCLSRHQKGDWFLAKHLASSGLVMRAHEFTPAELLDEDLHTAAYRWTNLAVESGIRFCSVRFFKILHAADPLESIDYIQRLSESLHQAGFSIHPPGPVDLTPAQPIQDSLTLAGIGLSAAGAAGLAADLLPVPDNLKLAGTAVSAAALAGLPFVGRVQMNGHHHPHDHHHHNGHHHHHHDHHHDHGPAPATAYAQKGLALAATVAYPAAALAFNKADALTALAHAAAVTVAGSVTVAATTIDADYLLGIEEYRGYNLDWLLPLGLAAAVNVLQPTPQPSGWLHRLRRYPILKTQNSKLKTQNSKLKWWPLAGIAVAALANVAGNLPADLPASLDCEHRHAHTHHLSQFQQQVGDLKMALSFRPLRKWSLLGPLGVVGGTLLKRKHRDDLAAIVFMAGVAGQIATLTGFRQGQRPLDKTAEDRAKSWLIGAAVAGGIGLLAILMENKK